MLFENEYIIPIPVSFYFLSEYAYEIKPRAHMAGYLL